VSHYRESGYCFGSTGEVRINCRYVCGHSHGEYDDMRDKYDALERERNNLRSDRDNWRKKHDELKDQLNNEKLENANKLVNERLSRQNTESTSENERKLFKEREQNFKKQIEDGKKELSLARVEKDKKIASVEGKLTQKDDEIKELEKKMEALRVDNKKLIVQRDNSLKETSGELERREQRIRVLQSETFKTKEELLIERLNLEKDNLEVFASELGINLEEVRNLTKSYRRLLFALKERNRDVIEDSEGKIAKTKQSLLASKISMENIRRISQECEKIARSS
jgi:chromosome segregation ATPase